VVGRVPDPEYRDRVLHLVEQEASHVRPDVVIVDRLQLEATERTRVA
jgi:hypothetical protein